MTFPHRLKFVLLLICCMQHALASNSSTHVTTNSSSAYVESTSTPVTTSSVMSTVLNVTVSTEYSSPDCTSCSNGGTITVTMSCSINKDTKCDEDEFMKTSCDYVTVLDKEYSCADLKTNFTYYEKKYLKPVKQCGDVCPASGSVLSAEFIFSSGLVVGLLLQTL